MLCAVPVKVIRLCVMCREAVTVGMFHVASYVCQIGSRTADQVSCVHTCTFRVGQHCAAYPGEGLHVAWLQGGSKCWAALQVQRMEQRVEHGTGPTVGAKQPGTVGMGGHRVAAEE